MGKINIGGELNPIYGRLGSAKHIYDYANKKSQEKINSLLLNELFSFDLGLKVTTMVGGVETDTNFIEYTTPGQTVSARVYWDIKRKHDFDFLLDRDTCPNGIVLEADNTENSSITALTEDQRWSRAGVTDLRAGKGKTSVTMTLNMDEGFLVTNTVNYYLVPPIYFGFYNLDTLTDDLSSLMKHKKLSTTVAGRYIVVNDTKGTDKDGNIINIPAYFYICIPKMLEINEIEVTSSGFKVPFEKVLNNNPNTGLDIYDCWRNPYNSLVNSGSEIVYDVIVRG